MGCPCIIACQHATISSVNLGHDNCYRLYRLYRPSLSPPLLPDEGRPTDANTCTRRHPCLAGTPGRWRQRSAARPCLSIGQDDFTMVRSDTEGTHSKKKRNFESCAVHNSRSRSQAVRQSAGGAVALRPHRWRQALPGPVCTKQRKHCRVMACHPFTGGHNIIKQTIKEPQSRNASLILSLAPGKLGEVDRSSLPADPSHTVPHRCEAVPADPDAVRPGSLPPASLRHSIRSSTIPAVVGVKSGFLSSDGSAAIG